MKKIIRLTESDLTIIVRKVISESKKQNNTRYYSNRNLRRLGRTPVVMLESADMYKSTLLNEGIIDTIKEKITSFFEKSKDFVKEKAESIKNSIENYFGEDIENITPDDIKTKLKNKFSNEEELKEKTNLEKFRDIDIGDETKEVGRPVQKVLSELQQILGFNAVTFGLIGSWLQSFFVTIPHAWLTHIVISVIGIMVIFYIRKLIAWKTGHKYSDKDKKDEEIKENFRRKYRRY